MKQKSYLTPSGSIVYWTNDLAPGRRTLVFLPGLTADHRLFDRQVEYFQESENVFVWDAPGHAASRPFSLTFSLEDKARWLHEILEKEGVTAPVLVGQSMGGYLAQMFLQLFPGQAAGFVCIDSAPLRREYYTGAELWLLEHIEPVYRLYPWKALVKAGSEGCACSPEGRALMRKIMQVYDGEKDGYCRLVGHGYRILAQAVEARLPYEISCPALIICGEQDKAGSTKRYNRAWEARTGRPVHWIRGAGHNSNTDRPEEVNALLLAFLRSLG